MAAELPRPGVEVIQVFKTVSPTVVTPTLIPCIVGVSRQVVDVLITNAAGADVLNDAALVPLQAVLLAKAAVGAPPVYAGLDTLILSLSLNHGPTLDITFVGTPLTPLQVVATILAAFSAAGVTAFTAEVVGTTQFRIRSVAGDEFQSIEVKSTTSASVLAAFGLAAGKVYLGASYYDQHITDVSVPSFPDPNRNLSQLAIDPATVRAFLYMGGTGGATSLLELLRTESFLRSGIGTVASRTGIVNLTGLIYSTPAIQTGTVDITAPALYGPGGTLDTLTLTLNINGVGASTLVFNGLTNTASEAALLAAITVQWPNLTATQAGPGGNKLVLTATLLGAASTIVLTGTAGATALGLGAGGTTTGVVGDLGLGTFILAIDSAANLTVTFASPTSAAVALAQINAVIGAVALATLDGSNFLVITSLATGATSKVEIIGGTKAATLGMALGATTGVAGVVSIDAGNGTQVTPLLEMVNANFTTAPTSAQVIGTTDITAGALYGGGGTLNNTTLTLDDGHQPQTLTFVAPANTAALLAAINALFGTAAGGRILATQGGPGGNKLVLTDTALGQESIVKVVSDTALGPLGLTAGATSRGGAYVPQSGDTLFVDGLFFATITQVTPGAVVTRLKIDKLVAVSSNVGVAWYIIAKNLSASNVNSGVTRPTPNLTVDATGNLLIKPEILRDTRGTPATAMRASLYVAYKALRLDVSPKAHSPGLLRFSDTTQLASNLSPITQDNPLALGMYFALLNAPGTLVTGIGVDEASASEPFGTVGGYTRAATFLEGFEVYGLAVLTHDSTVFQVFSAHVSVMSNPENKGERVVLINPSAPTTKLDTLVASGIDGNTTATPNQFDTGVANLSSLLLANGQPGVGPFTVATGIFLDVGDGKKYAVVNLTGSIVTLKTTGFLPGENTDAYYATTTLPSPLISQAFAIRVRGAKLVLLDGTPDKEAIALTVQQTAQGYGSRRVWSIFPDQCAATLEGIEQIIDGFYMSAAIAGMIGQQPPQQSFTNFPMNGFTRVIGSNGPYGERQLNVMAAGGNYIIVQDAPATPLIARMALTTDLTSIETRTDSITKVVDFTAKFLRQGLKNFIGRFNITQGFLDSLGHVIQGLLGFLTESGVLIGANLNNIVQDTNAPDTVLVDITLDVPFPCNYIRLTLVI
jgi:hypothetical protein